MNRFLSTALVAISLSTPAAAQSLKDAPVSWTGPYAGAHIGYGWLDGTHRQTNGGMPVGPYAADDEAPLAGVSLGYNHQMGQLVLGVEVEGGYMDIEGKGRIPSSTPGHYQAIDVQTGFYGLAAARAGFAWDRTLFYAKGGYALSEGDVGQKTTKPGFVTHRSDSLQGFVYGAGVEHKLNERMSIKFEWLRFDFDGVTGDQTSVTDIPVGFKYTNATDVQVDTLKLGVNFKF